MSATSEYLESESPNGHTLSPSEKAWETAKRNAVEEAQKPFFKQLDEELRALTDKNLSNGAARLFNLLCKCGWKKELGGLRNGVVGKILLDARRLAKLCGGASVNSLYHKTRPEKRNAKGRLIRAASETDGWIEELVKGGYLWLSKQPISNIQPARWPNLFHISCHVGQRVQTHLNLLEGVEIDEGEDCPTMWDRDSGEKKPADNGQFVKNGTAHHQNGGRAVVKTGDGPSPERGTGRHRNGGRAVTGSGDGPSPDRGTGRHRIDQQPINVLTNGPTVKPVQLRETGDGKPDPTDTKTGKAPPASRESGEKIFWNGRHWFPSALHKQLSLVDQAIARTEGVQRRELTAIRNTLLGALGIPPSRCTGRTATPAALKPATPAEILPKAELDRWMTDLRGAVQ